MDRPTERAAAVDAIIDAIIDAGDEVGDPDTATSADDILPALADALREETTDETLPDEAQPPDSPSERV